MRTAKRCSKDTFLMFLLWRPRQGFADNRGCVPLSLLQVASHTTSQTTCQRKRGCIGCSFCRLISRPEYLIGRHWYLPANWRSHSVITWAVSQSVLCHGVLQKLLLCVLCLHDSCESMSNQPALWTHDRIDKDSCDPLRSTFCCQTNEEGN
jgi:hypothetical protein